MIKNYFRIAFRNIQRHKGYSLINIIGLALGMACCILIILWVKDEMATDRYHAKLDSLYLVHTIEHYGSEVSRSDGSIPALAPALKAEYPEVLNASRINNGQGEHLLEYGGKQFKEVIQLADPEIFRRIFNLHIHFLGHFLTYHPVVFAHFSKFHCQTSPDKRFFGPGHHLGDLGRDHRHRFFERELSGPVFILFPAGRRP
jgi:hypothetical protein